ncbi:sigma 54-interacting transcriptional regulator [Geofilum sp. OHC36d9]|uniref:sigma 54-interacting transcriptional regulator n=1 Tax=Geofilum sp. OHC36d9 TaxID=3458413 RepID=UPI004033965F
MQDYYNSLENDCSLGNDCYGMKGLNLLLEFSDLLGDKDIDLNHVIAQLGDHLNAERIILAILNRENEQIFIEGAYQINDEEKEQIKYNPGQGVIGSVIQSGESVLIPKIADSNLFLNLTHSPLTVNGEDVSFICVPIRYKNHIIGSLSFHKVYSKKRLFDEDVRLLRIVGSMIGRAVRRRQEYAEELEQLRQENQILRGELNGHIQANFIVGNSGKMHDVFSLIGSVANTDATVLIRGESGVGKELIADAIHYNSLRKEQPFIKVNCAALPENLIESELFGHEKGAFTGAIGTRIGRFEAAHSGTIFLDEFGEIPLSTQVKLLRVLQQREIERVGGTKSIKVDVRVICATNRDLEKLIANGGFREDLYYRINVFPVYVPALRERINDIPMLANHFIEKFNKRHNKNIKRITTMAIDMLMVYHWPGNIRELENCMERACILCSDGVIRAHNLPPTLQTAVSSRTSESGSLDLILGKHEKQLIIDSLVSTKGNMSKASEILGITERMMGIRIKKYEIDPKRFKNK